MSEELCKTCNQPIGEGGGIVDSDGYERHDFCAPSAPPSTPAAPPKQQREADIGANLPAGWMDANAPEYNDEEEPAGEPPAPKCPNCGSGAAWSLTCAAHTPTQAGQQGEPSAREALYRAIHKFIIGYSIADEPQKNGPNTVVWNLAWNQGVGTAASQLLDPMETAGELDAAMEAYAQQLLSRERVEHPYHEACSKCLRTKELLQQRVIKLEAAQRRKP